jgi:hypothetical protein
MAERTFDLEATWNVVDVLFRLMRGMSAHRRDHPFAIQMATETRACIEAAVPPMTLQFVAQGVFRSRHLVPLNLERYQRAAAVGAALHNLAVNELSFLTTPTIEDIVHFGTALARGSAGTSDALESLTIDSMRWRDLPAVTRDVSAEAVDPDVAAVSHLSIALDEAERGFADSSQQWMCAAAVVRRLELANGLDPAVVARALELGTTASPARRLVAANHWLARCLDGVGIATAPRRATARALAMLSFAGLGERGGLSTPLAAKAALDAVVQRTTLSSSGIEPLRLRVTALLHGCGHSVQPRSLESLMHLLYTLECERSPITTTFDLAQLDLLAVAAAGMGGRFDEAWVRVFITAVGALPVGAQVLLADGRVAIVTGTGPDPFRPLVLVDGAIITPGHRVRLAEAQR